MPVLRLRVRHLTRFQYDGPVFDSFNDARLCPVNDARQRCVEFTLRLEPSAPVHTYTDFYGNRVDHFDLHQPHERLDVESIAIVETGEDPRGPVTQAYPPAALEDPGIAENYFEYLGDSPLVAIEPEVWRQSIDLLPNGVGDLWQDALTLGRHVHESFTYVPQATHAGTRMSEALRSRRGVCQDYAHVLLALCRSRDIPARYVSGYFYNDQRQPGEVEASHAWVEVFLPGYGWKGWDPTHGRETDVRYIKLAVGRDYSDIRPVSGSFRGKGTRQMTVEAFITREER